MKRCPILRTLNLGCTKSFKLATENETPMQAKKQASEGNPFNDDYHFKRIMDYDLRVFTCNIRTINRDRASATLAETLIKCVADITAIQEMRWIGQGCKIRKKLQHLLQLPCAEARIRLRVHG